jgi:hypothetical protein
VRRNAQGARDGELSVPHRRGCVFAIDHTLTTNEPRATACARATPRVGAACSFAADEKLAICDGQVGRAANNRLARGTARGKGQRSKARRAYETAPLVSSWATCGADRGQTTREGSCSFLH